MRILNKKAVLLQATTTVKGQEWDAKIPDLSISFLDAITDPDLKLEVLSIKLNSLLKEFDNIYNTNIWVGNVGFTEYPHKFKMQEKLQLFNFLAKEGCSTSLPLSKFH